MTPSGWDLIFANRIERDIKALAGEAHDCFGRDLDELKVKCLGIVALTSELLIRAERLEDERQDERAREEMAVSIPPVEG